MNVLSIRETSLVTGGGLLDKGQITDLVSMVGMFGASYSFDKTITASEQKTLADTHPNEVNLFRNLVMVAGRGLAIIACNILLAS